MANGIKPGSSQNYTPQTSSANEKDAAVQAHEQSHAAEVTNLPETEDLSKTKGSAKQQAVDRAALGGLEGMLRSRDINQEFERTTIEDIFLNQHPGEVLADGSHSKGAVPKYAKSLMSEIQNSKGFDENLVSKDNPNLDAIKSAAKEVKNEMKSVELLIAQGKYGAAKQHFDALLKKDFQGAQGTFNGEHVINMMKGAGPTALETTQSLMSQLDFVDKMQNAGIKDATLPPTEQQLKNFFAKFKDKPSAQQSEAAKQAFREYVGAFHVHPADSTGDASVDIVYGKGKTDRPETWKEITKDRNVTETGKYAGKYNNDCEGYAFLGDALLGAAGFEVKGFVSGMQDDGIAHIMVLLKDPQGKPAVTSNSEVYDENNTRLNGKTFDEQRLELLDGGWRGAGARGTPDFFIGKTNGESQSNMVNKSKSDRIQ